MDWGLIIFEIILLISITSGSIAKSFDENKNKIEKKKRKKVFPLATYTDKKVSLVLEAESCIVTCSNLYDQNTVGEIVAFDSEWLVYRFYDKKRKKTIRQYIRLRDIESIDIIEG